MRVRVSNLILIGGIVALVMVGLVAYAGFLTSAWGSLLACTPAVLVTIGLVGGMLCGMFFFDVEDEPDFPGERSASDGQDVRERSGERLVEIVHRTAIQLHVRGLGP